MRPRVAALLARPLPAALLTAVLTLPLLWPVIADWTLHADSPAPSDDVFFGPAGAALLTGRLAEPYASPVVQAGPLELAVFGALRLLGVTGRAPWTVVLLLLCALTVAVLALVLRPVRGPDLRSSALAAGGAALACVTEAVPRSWLAAHPAELAIPLLWVAAGRLARRDRLVPAAALVALSTGFETWGLLGLPVLLLAGRAPRRDVLAAAAAGAAVLAALWIPFLLAGPFRMGGYAWRVAPGAVWALVLPPDAPFPWALRAVQAVAVVAVAVAVALAARRRGADAAAPWLVPIAVVGTRLLLDPAPVSGYYWDAPALAAVGLLVLAARRRHPLLLVAAVLALAAAVVLQGVPGAALLVVPAVATPLLLRPVARPARAPARRPAPST